MSIFRVDDLENFFGTKPKVNQADLEKVSPCSFVANNDWFPVNNIICPDKEGPWIAGGACLAWYQNQPCTTDIDVYFANQAQYNWVEAEAKRYGSLVIETANAATYRITGTQNWTVQLIKKQFYAKLTDVIDRFDITVCQIGWDGKRVTVGKHFVHDVDNRLLRFNNITTQSHKRLVKYMCYGYTPVEGCIEQLVNHANIDWEAKGNDHYA